MREECSWFSERRERLHYHGNMLCFSSRVVPSLMIFKHKRFHESLKGGAPHGTVFTYYESGWMDRETFMTWLPHFHATMGCRTDKPVLLILKATRYTRGTWMPPTTPVRIGSKLPPYRPLHAQAAALGQNLPN